MAHRIKTLDVKCKCGKVFQSEVSLYIQDHLLPRLPVLYYILVIWDQKVLMNNTALTDNRKYALDLYRESCSELLRYGEE